MGAQPALRGSVVTVTRRFAAGTDITERAVRLAVVSKRLQANRPVCVERLEEVLLPRGAVVSGDFVDGAAISAALREAFSRRPARGALRSLRCAMALPASATLTTRVLLEKLSNVRQKPGRDPRGVLEPAVLAEAERVAGIERGALSVDWSIYERNDGCTEVSIAATARQYVESRVEAAAGADIAFVEAPSDLEQIAAVPKRVNGPCLFNIVRGGKSPDMALRDVQKLGYTLAILPSVLLASVMQTCESTLKDLRATGVPPASSTARRSICGPMAMARAISISIS